MQRRWSRVESWVGAALFAATAGLCLVYAVVS